MIEWIQEDLIDPKNDLCAVVNGMYVEYVEYLNWRAEEAAYENSVEM